MTLIDTDAVWCPSCSARPGEQCKSVMGGNPVSKPHRQRITAARRRSEGSPERAPLKRSAAETRIPITVPKDQLSRKKRRKREGSNIKPSSVKAVIARSGGRCEGNIGGVCPPHPHDGVLRHHVIGRPHLPRELRDDPRILLNLCDEAHRWIHAHPAEARALESPRVLAPEWAVKDFFPELAG